MNLLWTDIGRVSLTVHGENPPTDKEWEEYLTYVASVARRDPGDALRALIVSHGGVPSSAQRRRLVGLFESKGIPAAFLTVTRTARAIGAAVAWFNRRLQIYWLEELPEACRYLSLSSTEVVDVQRELGRLSAELGVNDSRSRSS